MSYLAAHWPDAWLILACCALLAAAHLAGLARLAAARPAAAAAAGAAVAGAAVAAAEGADAGAGAGRGRRAEAAAFYAGLLVVLVALASPLRYWSGVYIWVRSVQDLLLAVVAPALIVLGAPWQPLAEAGRAARRRPAVAAGLAGPHPDEPPVAGRRAAWPVGVTLAFCIAWLAWHLPALYDLPLGSPVAWYAEYASYLAVGVLLWLQLIGSRPLRPVCPPLRRVAFLTAVVVVDTILGMVLVFGSSLVYPAYLGVPHHAESIISDQQLGGGVLWMGMLPAFIIAAVALLAAWLTQEDADDPSRELARLTSRPAAGWASRGRGGPAAWPASGGTGRTTI